MVAIRTLYVAQRADNTGLVKVGTTTHLERRMVELQRAHGCPIIVLRADQVEYGVEALVHKVLKRWSAGIGREWFFPTPNVMGMVLSWSIDQFIRESATRGAQWRRSRPYTPKATQEVMRKEAIAICHLGRMPGNTLNHAMSQRGIANATIAATIGTRSYCVGQMRQPGRRCDRNTTAALMAIFREHRLRLQASKGFLAPKESC